jgi:parallel beta-helix repeat protein
MILSRHAVRFVILLVALTISSSSGSGRFTWRTVTQTYFTIDVGRGSHPAFCDIDADGDLDLFVGEEYGAIYFYRNTGTSDSAFFTLATTTYFTIDVGWWANPTFVDIDNDGDDDLYVGNADAGGLYFYRNTGRPDSAYFTYVNLFDTHGYGGTPRFVDIDNDGDLDMFVGHDHHGNNDPLGGKIAYYRNDGTVTSPNFTFVTDQYGGISTLNASYPFFVDLDHDGDYDLLIGNEKRNALYYYRNDGTASAPSFTFETDDYYRLNHLTSSTRQNPFLADIDNDGKQEMFMGKLDGTITYSRQDTSMNLYVATTGNDVTGSGSSANPYRTIKKALLTSAAYDSIIVRAGLYNQAGGDSLPLPLRSDVALTSESGPGQTTISGGGTRGVVSCDSLGGTPVISGFRITGGNRGYGAGIYVNYCGPSIIGNIITGNSATTDGGGIYIRRGNPLVTLNRIRENRAAGDGGGIVVTDTCTPVIRRNIIANNTAGDAGGGIYAYNSFPTISKNTVAGNIAAAARGAGIFTIFRAKAAIDSNAIMDNYIGAGCWTDADTSVMRGNNVYCNTYQQADTEIYNQSTALMRFAPNFWLTQDSAAIDRVIVGPAAFMPVLSGQVADAPGEPAIITQVRVFSDSSYTSDLTSARSGDTMYLQLIGNDWNYHTFDPALVIVRSTANTYGIGAALLELDTLSGFYRGRVALAASSSDMNNRIAVRSTDTIVISSRADTTKTDTVFIYTTGIASRSSLATTALGIISVKPNPANGPLTITWRARSTADVTLKIFNVSGRCVGSWVHKNAGSGVHSTTWEINSRTAHRMPAGVYLLSLTEGPEGAPVNVDRRMVMVR